MSRLRIIDFSMNPQPKNNIIRLGRVAMKNLQKQAHDRDNGRCLICGQPADSPPHHIEFSSGGGSDVIGNLASICLICHDIIHNRAWLEIIPRLLMQYKGKQIIQYILKGILNGG